MEREYKELEFKLHRPWPLLCKIHEKEMQFLRAKYDSNGSVGLSGSPKGTYKPHIGWIGVCIDCYGYEAVTRKRTGSAIGVWIESP